MKKPQWFEEWLENDYEHLRNDVCGIKKDLSYWVKPLLFLILSAVIVGAIAIIVG